MQCPCDQWGTHSVARASHRVGDVARRRRVAACTGAGRAAGRRRAVPQPTLGGCPVLPGRQRVEHRTSSHAARAQPTRRRSSRTSTSSGTTNCIPTSAATARTASRSRSCPRPQPKVPDPLHRVRRRERSRPVPDPGERARRRRRASDGDRHVLVVQQGHVSSLRARARVLARRPLGRRRRRELEPALEHAAPGGVDVGGRGGAADPARARALRRGRGGSRSTTRCASPCRRRRRATSFPATHYASSSTESRAAADGAAPAARRRTSISRGVSRASRW